MPKDYKDRVPNAWRGSRRRGRPIWVWLLPVLVLAGAGAVALIRHQRPPDEVPAETAEKAPEPATKSKTALATKPAGPEPSNKRKPDAPSGKKPGKVENPPDIDLPEPRFTFYKILPEKEVIVSEREIMSLKREEKAGKPATPGGFVIQVGAYSKLEDAEKTKARLSEAKVKAKMEKVLIENATWYRVKLGPFSSLADAEKVRAQLRKYRIDSVLQQNKPTK